MLRKYNKVQKLHIKKGDTVKVLSGENRGKLGKVLLVYPKKLKAIVEGVNMIKKHMRPNEKAPKGEIREMEAPIYVCKLQLVDPANNKPTRVGRKRDSNNRWQRKSVKTGEIIK